MSSKAGIDAIQSGFTRYTNVDGVNELKDAIIAKFERDNAIKYDRAQVLISSGAKQTIYNLCMAVLDPGDEAIIPAPYWVSYPDMVLLADGLPGHAVRRRLAGIQDHAAPAVCGHHVEDAARAAEQPVQPDRRGVHARGAACGLRMCWFEHPRILIGTDDMYEKIYWGSEPFCSLLTVAPELYGRTITINGVSKAYAMTGLANRVLRRAEGDYYRRCRRFRGSPTSNASSISQKAAIAALAGDQECVAKMNEAFKQRHDFIVAGLNSLPGVSCLPGAGTFYAFADVSKAITAQGCRDDGEFAELLLNEGGVAVVPGGGFGAPGHIRLSFACSMQTLESGEHCAFPESALFRTTLVTLRVSFVL